MPGIFRLIGSVKHYDWGGTDFIPGLLARENASGKPFAEYWLGTHGQAECMILVNDSSPRSLKEYISSNPELLGDAVKKEFGHLPYLLKVLDVKQMLSIQVHPSKSAAEVEFARETAAGVPMNAVNRNYKDPNHKPEMMVACGDFWLLHGFKSTKLLEKTLADITELNPLLPIFKNSGYEGLYRYVMQMSQQEVNDMLDPLVKRIVPLYNQQQLNKEQESYWAAQAAIWFAQPGGVDRGIFSIFFLNLLKLKKGEGIFQPAGLLHAYLEGQNVEIMASSDNVLRGGLTSKHIDVEELLKHVKCEPADITIMKGQAEGPEKVYDAKVPDFLLSSIALDANEVFEFSPRSAEILLLLNGKAKLETTGQSIWLQKGEPAAISFPGQLVRLIAREKTAVFKASVPQRV